MMARLIIISLLGLLALGYAAKCPTQNTSPGREIVCYTTTYDVKRLENNICKCTTLIHQGHDVQTLVATGLDNLRKSLKEINPVLQFVVSINDARGTLKTSANARQEAVARIVNIFNEVDGVELNVTAGSKERLVHFVQGLKDEMTRKSKERRILVQLPTKAEELAKQFDVKSLSKFVDLFTIPTHYLMGNDDKYKTFHPSRLMGLFDLLNTDSLVDLVHGLGAAKRKILVSLPASGYKFTLKIKDENTAGDDTEEEMPGKINRQELCDDILEGEWTIERDEDLTAPYTFKDNIWIAFEDKISVGIKGKYVLLRNLAGVAITDVDDDLATDCGKSLTEYIYHSFTDNKRKSREAVLTSLQDDIYNVETSYPDNLKSSDFRISRVVDINGKIHSVRENTQTEFSCSRQGYFVHPKSCNRFYRCVKFNQEIEHYSVFEFDCPAGLAFDERTEVCVWPGSLPEGSPCPGSPEIAPTAPRRFRCPGHGYYADPQNCRWFFACIDLGEEKMMAYEFQCPYGLVFDEHKLVCEWPWLVPDCTGKNYEHNGGSGFEGHGGQGGGDSNGGYGENDVRHGGHGGYDQPNKGGHGGESPHSGHGESGYNGYDGGSYGGHGTAGHSGNGGGSSHGGHGGHAGSGQGGHGGYDQPNKGGHGGEYPHDGQGESGHNGSDGGSHDGHGTAGHSDNGGGSSHGGHGGHIGSGQGGHGGYDQPNKGGHGGEYPHSGQEESGHNGYDDGSYGGHGTAGHSGNGGESSHGGHGGHTGSGQGGHGGYDQPNKGAHGGEYPHNGQGESGHNGYDDGSYGGHDGGSSQGGHGTAGHSGNGGGSSHGGHGGHAGSGQGDHGGYDQPNKGGHGEGHPHIGQEESGHSGDDGGSYGDHDGGSSHGDHGNGGHGVNGGGSSHGGHESHDGSEQGGHGGYDRPNKGGHDEESFQGGHGGHKQSADGGQGHEEYDETNKGDNGEGYPHGGPGEFDDSNNNDGHDGDSSLGGHETLGDAGDDGEFAHGGNGVNQGHDESHDGGSLHGVHTDHEEPEHSGHDERPSDGDYDEHGGQTEHGDKNNGNYDKSNKDGHNGGLPQSRHDDHDVNGHVTQSDYGKQGGHGGHSQGGHATSSYTTSAGHFTISHDGFSPSDGAKFTTTGGAYAKGYPGPPTIILGSDGSQYTTAGQTYSGSTRGETADQGYYTGGNVNGGITSSIGNTYTGFGTKTTDAGYSSSIYRGDAGNTGGFNKGATTSNFGTVQTSGDTSGIIINGANREQNIIGGVTQPGRIHTQPGTSGYVITNGVKTIYDGNAVPQTSLYDTTSSGLPIGGHTASGGIVKGQTPSGIYFSDTGAGKISTINMGNGYYTNQAQGGHTTNVVSKGGLDFTAGGSTISSGNQYYPNQAGTLYTGIAGPRGHIGGFTPSIPITSNGNGYYEHQSEYNKNIGTSRGTAFTPAVSVTSTGNKYYTNQAGMSTSDNNREIPIKSTVTGGYETNEYHDNGGRGTIRYNNGVVTHKYTEDDVRDHRTSFRIPPATQVTPSDIFTPVPGGVYTRGGFTKTGPTKTGITTAQLGGTGTYIAGVSTVRPHINTDHIGENAFGTVNKDHSIINIQRPETVTYSYDEPITIDKPAPTQLSNEYEDRNIPVSSQSPFFNVHVYNTPTVLPSAPITASPAVVNTYSYANPTSVQYQENTYQSTKSSSNSASTGQYANPFFNTQRKYSTVSPTVESVSYTTAPYDNYRTTIFEAARIPVTASTVTPIVDNGYKTVISSTSIPVPVENSRNYDYNESGGSTNFAENAGEQFLDVGVSFQHPNNPATFSTIQPGYSRRPSGENHNQRVTPSVSYQQSTIGSEDSIETLGYNYDQTNSGFGEKINQAGSQSEGSISYHHPTVTIQPQVYQRPSTIASFQSGDNYRQSTSPTKGNAGVGGYNYPRPDNEFVKSSTPSVPYTTVRPIKTNGSPFNPSIDQNKVEKIVTNYNNRGNVKYTVGYDAADDNDKSSNQIVTVNRDNTTPQPKVTTYSGGHRRISTTPKYEVNKSTEIGRVKSNGKVIVKFSDLHPILLGKLGAECTCKADPFVSFKGNKPLIIDSSKGKVDLRNYDESDVYVDLENSRETELQDYNEDFNTYRSSTPLPENFSRQTPVIALFNGVKSSKSQSQRPSSNYLPASTPCPPSSNYFASTTSSPLRVSASDIEASASYTSDTIRSRSGKSLGSSRANTLPSFDTSPDQMKSDEIGVLEMSAEGEATCARPGLFRHPKFCNKFYVCHWDEWKKKFTLHIFNCPIHLTFDNHASACNWPSKGPACQDDNILV